MIISVLTEDTAQRLDLTPEHGLSLFLEWDHRKILFDTGASGIFLDNAQKMKINPAEAELLVLSHGHRDHTGGLLAFLKTNLTAPVYLRPEAIGPRYALRTSGLMENIGTDPVPEFALRLRFTEEVTVIDKSLTLFSNVAIKEFPSQANKVLFEKNESPNSSQEFILDQFRHEQHLIVTTAKKQKILIVGCAHSGIVNIIERFIKITGQAPDAAIGGFHLMIPSRGDAGANPESELNAIAKRLAAYPTRYWTGHCSGKVAIERLQKYLQDRINPISAGNVIDLNKL